MRITGFHVDGFGLLHDQLVEGIPAGTTVVLGPNEAGKSTLHAFLVRTLFGHPRSNDAAGRNRHDPIHGGRHGGTVRARDAAGDWEVHRFTQGSPRLRVVGPDGTERTGEEAVLPLLGRVVDQTRYEQVFAIDLDDLAGVGSLGGGALDDLLFDAATVGTGRSLRAARDEAAERRDELWTPTATTRPLAAALRDRDEAAAAVDRAREHARGALDTRRRLDAVAARVEELGRAQQEARARAALLERVLDAWPSWHRAARLRDQLDELPSATADGDEVERARAAVEEVATATRRHEAARRAWSEAVDRVDAIDVDECLAALADRIDTAAEGLGAHDLATEQLTVAVRDLEAAEAELAAGFDELGTAWGEERVRAVPVATEVHQRLELVGDELLDAQLQRESARERAAEAKRLATRRAEAADARAAAVPDAPSEQDVAAAEQAVAVLRAGVPALAERRTTGRAAQPLLPMVLVLVTLGLVVGVAVTGLPADASGAVVVAGVAVVVAVAAYLAGRSTAPSTAGGARSTPPGLRGDVTEAAGTLGLSAIPSLAEVEGAASEVTEARNRRRAATEAARWEQELRREAADAQRTAREARAALDERDEQVRTVHRRWTQLCDEVGLDAAAPVRVTIAVHDRVRRTARLLRAREAAADAVARLRPRVEDHRADVVRLLGELGIDHEGRDVMRRLPGLRDRARAARAGVEERGRLAEARRRAEEASADAAGELEAARAALRERLVAIGVQDVDELERVADVLDRRVSLQRERAAAEGAVAQLLGSGPRGARARERLAAADPGGWQEELAELEQHLEALADDRDRALADRTRLEGELRRIGGDDAVPRAQQALAAARVEVAELVERWAVADTAARLLEETVARFEREQQPRVLTRASELFARATGGRWAQLRRLDRHVVVARAHGGEPVAAEVLSRGTREQLWLCLRLALAEDLARDRPLPLLVDDLLGTSDPERSRHVAEVLAEVAGNQQVWLFTCHPATAELVTATDPTAAVLRLDHGGRVAGLDLQPDGGGAQMRITT